ncbi:MAG TPA: SEC-C metal-binding domain-containing protein, partial [Pararhizobium sp.]|nr:SEC-C metal-binding domain-containing protein [Pararhizobium sp.]
VMEDAEADEFVRDAVFKTWTYEVLAGAVGLEEARSCLAEFPETHAPPKGSFVWTSWVDTVSALALEDLSGLVEKCFADQMIEDNAWPAPIMRLSDFQKDLTEAKANADNRLERFPHQPFDSTIGELSNWSGYAKSESGEDVASRLISDERDFLLREPATNPHRDVGRNDPCPCGSGKKYKKCCLVQ